MVSASRIDPPGKPTAILTGTTASGKTALALEFARAHGEIEIVNADSLLVFRGFDIGTAKPSEAELAEIPHHLVDIRNPEESFNAGDFILACDSALKDIHGRGKRALITGGTGFYLKALIFGLWDSPKSPPEMRARLELLTNEELFARLLEKDEPSALRISMGDRYRLLRALETIESSGKTPTELEAEASARGAIPGLSLLITDRGSDDLKKRIAARSSLMLTEGFVEEVSRLRESYPSARALDSVGYVEVIRYLDGIAPAGRKIEPGTEGLRSEIELATNQLAKRQRTFFGNASRGQFTRARDLKFFTLEPDRATLWKTLEDLYC
ncbi:MAG: tRNA (adenosine(37)-N6)-dimethylallyltransferase MiaA [Cryobacterium sp.]|nr:tRNA (adenosine(37)-N6)-dimethylallyltransferase MiaA [Oligoflexia bacterium]